MVDFMKKTELMKEFQELEEENRCILTVLPGIVRKAKSKTL